jgi:hypothetical protein
MTKLNQSDKKNLEVYYKNNVNIKIYFFVLINSSRELIRIGLHR